MATLEQLLEVITDPYEGREEGVDFWVDENGYIQTMDVRTAALIMRTANNSGVFEQNLVRVGQKGDSILLGFDELLNVDPVYAKRIGFKGDTLAEVKVTEDKKFCLYLNKKRAARVFKKLSTVKSFIKKLDSELQEVADEPENFDD